MKTNKILLIGQQNSHFSAKARCYCVNRGLDVEYVPATVPIMAGFVIPATKTRFIPVAVTADGKVIQDTKRIMDHFESEELVRIDAAMPALPKMIQFLAEMVFDEWFTMFSMHYRWNIPEQLEFVLFDFATVLSDPNDKDQVQSISAHFQGIPGKIGCTPETIPTIEAQFKDWISRLDKHLERMPFLLGFQPCFADFALVGPLFAHLARDPVPSHFIKMNAPRVYDYVERCMCINPSRRVQNVVSLSWPGLNPLYSQQKGFVGENEIPDFMLYILSTFFLEFVPYLVSLFDLAVLHFEQSGEKALKKHYGSHLFRLWNPETNQFVFGKRLVLSHSVTLLDRFMRKFNETNWDILLKFLPVVDSWCVSNGRPNSNCVESMIALKKKLDSFPIKWERDLIHFAAKL
jgi:glutathione S-transferase